MVRQFTLVLLSLAAFPSICALAREPKALKVYFVGNSVTDTINYDGLAEMATSRGYQHVWGRHMIPGAPLHWIWQHPDEGFQQPPFGHFPQALKQYAWDAICLQPFDRHLLGDDGDVAVARNFISTALPTSPNLQVYLYARWPRRARDGTLNYGEAWLRKYTGQWDNTNETKDYFERLVRELRTASPELKNRVLMVPVGHVMHELDLRMKAGDVPGFSGIEQVYRDDIHLDNVGSYVVACTFFATLYREDPANLPTTSYQPLAPETAKAIPPIVWNVVSTHELSGVARQPNPGEPIPPLDAKPPAPVPLVSKAAASTAPRPETRDERYRRLVVGTWEDEYQGKRTMTLRQDGTGTMLVELTGLKATLFAARLRFDMKWSIADGRLKKRTVGGEPSARVQMILKTMGDRVDEPILALTDDQLLLLDKDGETRYDWRRKK